METMVLVVIFTRGHHLHHASLNDVVLRSLVFANIACHLELSGFSRSDGKRPDGASLDPWKGGKVLTLDVTCLDTLDLSYATLAVHEPGTEDAQAEYRKTLKYGVLPSACSFISTVVETLGVIGNESRQHTEKESDGKSALQHLLEHIPITVQRGNAAYISVGNFELTCFVFHAITIIYLCLLCLSCVL